MERAWLGKVKLILDPGVRDSDASATRRRVMDQHTTGALGDWPRFLKVKKDDQRSTLRGQ